jgi:hypothetical protein
MSGSGSGILYIWKDNSRKPETIKVVKKQISQTFGIYIQMLSVYTKSQDAI